MSPLNLHTFLACRHSRGGPVSTEGDRSDRSDSRWERGLGGQYDGVLCIDSVVPYGHAGVEEEVLIQAQPRPGCTTETVMLAKGHNVMM